MSRRLGVVLLLLSGCGPLPWFGTAPAPHQAGHDLGGRDDGGLPAPRVDLGARDLGGVKDLGTADLDSMDLAAADLVLPAAADLTASPDLTPMCTSDESCGAELPLCTMGSCGPCTADSTACATYHQATPRCGPKGACVECLGKDDCEAKHQTCDLGSNHCTGCRRNEECSSGLCEGGQCTDKSTLLYVNNASDAHCSNSGDGAFATPFCTVQVGVDASAARHRRAVVFGGRYPEALTVGATESGAALVGVGGPRLAATSGAALKVTSASGKKVSVRFEGLIFDASGAKDGLLCVGDGSNYGRTLLTLARSRIENGPTAGLAVSAKCSLDADALVVTGNRGGGLKLDDSNFTVRNLLVIDNGGADAEFGGIYISAGGQSMSLANVTVVGNHKRTSTTPSGIACAAAPATFINAVAEGNAPGTELAAVDCGAHFSAFVGGGGDNRDLQGCAVVDLFVDAAGGDYHPKAGGRCSLVGAGTSSGAPDHDLDGASRPPSGAGDIGCYAAR